MMVRTRGLGKRFGRHQALREIDLEIAEGSAYGLVGRNGAGKTTLLSILAGLRRPGSGSLELAADRFQVASCLDVPSFEPWLTAAEVLRLAGALSGTAAGRPAVLGALSEAGLAGSADQRVGGFSRGMTQRLALAATFFGKPRLVLLDEPTSALDPAGRAEALDLIARLAGRTTVVFSSHSLADVERVCDTVGILDAGRLVHQGPLRHLLAGRSRSAWRIRVRPGEEAQLVAALRAQPWAARAERSGPGAVRLAAADPEGAEAGLIGALAGSGARVIALEPEAADLETAFLALTGPHREAGGSARTAQVAP